VGHAYQHFQQISLALGTITSPFLRHAKTIITYPQKYRLGELQHIFATVETMQGSRYTQVFKY